MAFNRRLTVVERFRVALTRVSCPITRLALEQKTLTQFIISAYVSERHRYVYINNPKTGCTTLKTALVELELRDAAAPIELSDPRLIHGNASPLKQRPPIWPASTLTRRVRQGYKFLSFVRNPYARLVSSYFGQVAGDERANPGILRDLPGGVPESFAAFVQQITPQTDFAMNPH